MRLRHWSLLLVPTCAAWLGCAGGEPGSASDFGDGQSPVNRDSPSGEPQSDVDVIEPGPGDSETPSADVVLVKQTTRFHTAVGIAERSEDLSANPPEIYVPSGTTFSVVSGSASPQGWRFTGIPSGAYYLRTGNSFIITSAREVDIGSQQLGRPDTVFSQTLWTPLQMNLVNLAPWSTYNGVTEPGSSLQIASAQVNLYGAVNVFDAVADGQTHLLTNDADVFTSTANALPVFEANKGDRLYVSQHAQLQAGTLPDGRPLGYSALVRSVEMGAFDFVPDGVTPMPLTGVMRPVPMREFPIEWRLPEFTRHAEGVHPLASANYASFYVMPAAHGLSDGWVGYSGETLSLMLPRGTSFNFTRRLSYGNPFPSSWEMVAAAQYTFRVLEEVPDGSGTLFSLGANMYTYEELDSYVAGPVVPRVSPPREVTIDGVPASTPREVGTASPVIAWLPPVVGTPSLYRVLIYRFDTTRRMGVLHRNLYVPGSATQVRLPPGTLDPAAIHYLRVAAMEVSGYDLAQNPFSTMDRLPHSRADAISSFFTTP
ncbi:hypothetical protein [Myxococcus hansupus]|uniref:hypothetical protein n=1 Tax=Pseudomyxococcus hansupus TaxID=1297742 RepID=UPI0005D11450|nr:hypothetical protein [Myxococcus hansupus]